MPPLSTSWLRGTRADASSWLTPSQRVVRVLQVTSANWHVLPGSGRKKRRGGFAALAGHVGKQNFAS